MRTARLPTVGVSMVSTRCQYGGPRVLGPQVNKFEQVFSGAHQMSVAGDGVGIQDPCHMSGCGGGGVRYSEVRKGHMEPFLWKHY